MRLSTFALVSVLSLPLIACSSGDDSAPGTAEGDVQPCNDGTPAFDVWRANFAPNDRRRVTAQVNTRSSATAAEFRLVLGCEDEIVADVIGGSVCSHDPPQIEEGDKPECPFVALDVDDIGIGSDGFIECFAEIGITEALDIGTGGCANPDIAEYRLRMEIDNTAIALDLVADNCRDEDSCLESMFGFEDDD